MYRRLFWKKIIVVMGILWCLSARIDAGESLPVMIYAPAGPTSIPLILAAESLPGVKVKIFTNHSKAHALFLKGKVQILCTGLSVGVGFYRQGVPVQIINSHVSGLAWLVTNIKVTHFKDLRGMTIYLPFPGSPLEELTRFFMGGGATGVESRYSYQIHRVSRGRSPVAAASHLRRRTAGTICFPGVDTP